ncbi:YadA-like family protein [Mannheimia indoligenes]|uniref:YadA-like family protein n=1 Tax=Mannheimia indoligenes TaxID=3103145 RepID=UPI002FE580DC
MNNIFKVIWNHSTQSFVVASELARSQGKSSNCTVSTPDKSIKKAMFTSATFAFTALAGSFLLSGQASAYNLTGTTFGGGTANNLAISPSGGNSATIERYTADGYSDVDGSIAVGKGATSNTSYGIAIGQNANIKSATKTSTTQSIAIGGGKGVGEGAQATGDQSISIGGNTVASGSSSIAIGGDDLNQVSEGADTDAGKEVASKYKELTGDSILRGVDKTGENYKKTTASGGASIAVGTQATSSGNLATAFGTRTTASGLASTALGMSAKASGNTATAVGAVANATGEKSIAIGTSAQALANNTISIGAGSIVNSQNSGAIGNSINIKTGQTDVFALGNNITNTAGNSVFLGSNSAYVGAGNSTKSTDAYTSDNSIITGKTLNFAGGNAKGVVSVGGSGSERRIQNVAAGLISSGSTDAINGSQLYAVLQNLPITSTNTPTEKPKNYFHVNPSSSVGATGGSENLDAVDGIGNATGGWSVTAGYEAISSGKVAVAIGKGAAADSLANIAIGEDAKALTANKNTGDLKDLPAGINKAIAIGSNAQATNAKTIAIGDTANASGKNANAIGSQAVVSGEESTGIGTAVSVTGSYATGIGQRANAVGVQSVAIGTQSVTTAYRATAIGRSAVAAGSRATALSADSSALGSDSLAVGAYARTTAASATAVGHGADGVATNAVALGRKATGLGTSSIAIGENAIAGGNAVAKEAYNTAYKTAYEAKEKAIYDEVFAATTGTNAQKTAAANAAKIARQAEIIAAGHQAGQAAITSMGIESIAIGKDATATGTQSIAIGTGNLVSGNNAGAFGDPSIVQGNASYTFGNDNVVGSSTTGAFVLGNNNQMGATPSYQGSTKKVDATQPLTDLADVSGSVAIGNENKVTTQDTFILGSGINTANDGKSAQSGTVANSVYLGKDSTAISSAGNNKTATDANGTTTTGGATGTVNTATVNNFTYSDFAGATSTGAVTVGSAGAERRLMNVAAGQISSTSTDAINGSQLYAVADKLGQGFNVLDSAGTKKGTVTPGENVQFVNGTNTTSNVTQEADGTTKVSFNVNIPTTNISQNAAGTTSQGRFTTPSGQSNSFVTAANITTALNNTGFFLNVDENGGTATDVSADKKISNGDTFTLAAGENITINQIDNGYEISAKAPNATVITGGNGTTVTSTGDAENPSYQVIARVDGNTVVFNGNGQISANTTTYAPSTTGTVGNPTNPDALVTAQTIANAINQSGFNVTAGSGVDGGTVSGKTTELVNPGETVTFDAGKNMKLVQENGKFTYATKDDVSFNRVTVGNTNPVVINEAGINAGNKPISNVADGKAPQDAVNVRQLNAVKETVVSTDKSVTVTSNKTNADGGKEFDLSVNVDGDTIINDNGVLKATTKAPETTNLTVNEGKVAKPSESVPADGNKFVTADEIADTINHSGFKVTKDGDARDADSLVNAGENLNFKDGTQTTVDVKGNTVTVNVNTTNLTNNETNGTVNAPTPEDAGKLVTAQTVADAVNNAGFMIKSAGNKAAGDEEASKLVKTGEEVTFEAGTNLTVKRVGNQFTFATAPVVAFDQVTVGPVVINKDSGINAGNTQIKGVKSGTEATDAVNLSQLNAAKTVVDGTSGVTVTSEPIGENGKDGTKYVVSAKTDGKTVKVDPTGNITAVTTPLMQGADGKATTNGDTTSLVTGDQVATAINNAGLSFSGDVAQDATNLFKRTNQQETKIIGGETDKTKLSDKNIGVVSNGLDSLTVKLSKVLTGLTSADFTDAVGNTTKVEGNGITIDPKADGKSNVTLTTEGLNNGSNKITNVAAGVDNTDAVNVSQLNQKAAAAKTEVKGSGLATVAVPTKGANGQDIYTVHVAKAEAPTVTRGNVTVKAGDEGKVMTAGDVANAITNSEKTSSVKAGSAALTVKTGAEDDKGNTEYTVDLAEDLKKQIAKEESVTAGNNNLTVEQDTTNATGGKNYKVTLSNNLDLGNAGSVKMGDVTTNADGLTINNGTASNPVSLTKDGLDNGGNKITNVAEGVADSDAVNVGQLNNVVNNSINNSGFTLKTSGNIESSTGDEKINPNDTVEMVAGKNLTVKQEADGKITYATANDVDFNNVTATNSIGITNGPTMNTTGINAAGKKVTGVADGDISPTSTDAVNGSQIYALSGGNINKVGDYTVTNPDGTKTTYQNVVLDENGEPVLITYNVKTQGEHITNSVITAINNMNSQGIKFFHTNDGKADSTRPSDQRYNSEDSSASGAYATAVGYQSEASGTSSVAMGNNSTAAGENAIAIGVNAQANAKNTISIGNGNIVNGENSGAFGDPTTINATNSYSVGNNNELAAGQSDVFALGNEIKETTSNSVFLGSKSGSFEQKGSTRGNNGVHKKTANSNYTYRGENDANVAGVENAVGVVSVGNANETRQIQGVAAGVVSETSTDAINGSQLHYTNKAIGDVKNDINKLGNAINKNNRNLRAGIAGANAAAGLPQVYLPGKSMVAASAGTFKGEGALAVGYSRASDNGKVILKLQGNANTRGEVGGSVGVGYQW